MYKMNWYLILDFDSTIITKESLDFLSEIALENEKNKDFLLSKIIELTEKGIKYKNRC